MFLELDLGQDILGLCRLGSVCGGGPGLVGHTPGHGAGGSGYHLHLHAELGGWGAWQSKANSKFTKLSIYFIIS